MAPERCPRPNPWNPWIRYVQEGIKVVDGAKGAHQLTLIKKLSWIMGGGVQYNHKSPLNAEVGSRREEARELAVWERQEPPSLALKMEEEDH